MRRKQIDSQLNNTRCQNYYLRRCLTMAENVYNIKNLPLYIDKAFTNKKLVRNGSIAFFRDEVLGLLALPYTILGKLDVYKRPIDIQVYGQNGYIKKWGESAQSLEYTVTITNGSTTEEITLYTLIPAK